MYYLDNFYIVILYHLSTFIFTFVWDNELPPYEKEQVDTGAIREKDRFHL